MQQLKLSSLLSPLSPFLFSRCLAFSPSPSLCHLTSSVSLVCLTDSKSPSLCPRSLCLPCQSPPHLLLLLLSWLLSLSLSLTCLLFFSFNPPFPSIYLSLSPRLPLSLFFPSPTRSFAFPLPPAFCFAAVPLPAHLFCLFSGPPPPLLLSHPDSLTPPPSYFSASVTPANFPLPSAFLSCRSPPLLFSPHSLSPSILFLHVGELTGAAGTTGREQ